MDEYTTADDCTGKCAASSVLTGGFDAAKCQRPATHRLVWDDPRTGVPCAVEACRSCADSFTVRWPRMRIEPLEPVAVLG